MEQQPGMEKNEFSCENDNREAMDSLQGEEETNDDFQV
jgi:hypothetical protein